ncbi:MAG: hypothetical protein U0271_18090 [Polyangiaceae bacterium]
MKLRSSPRAVVRRTSLATTPPVRGVLVIDERLADVGTHAIVVRGPGNRSADTTPPFDVSKLAGARFIGVVRADNAESRMVAGCVRGPASRFAPGIENVLFEHATYRALAAVEASPLELAVERSVELPAHYERLSRGRTREGALTLHHVLTFTNDGDGRDLLLCTLACRGPGCEQAELVIAGSPPDPPPPNLLIRGVFGAFAHPGAVLAVAAALALVVVAWILKRRPSPRPW